MAIPSYWRSSSTRCSNVFSTSFCLSRRSATLRCSASARWFQAMRHGKPKASRSQGVRPDLPCANSGGDRRRHQGQEPQFPQPSHLSPLHRGLTPLVLWSSTNRPRRSPRSQPADPGGWAACGTQDPEGIARLQPLDRLSLPTGRSLHPSRPMQGAGQESSRPEPSSVLGSPCSSAGPRNCLQSC